LVVERVDKKPLEKFKMKPTLGRFKKEPKQVQKKAGRQEALGKVQNEAHIRKVQKGTQTSTKKSLARDH